MATDQMKVHVANMELFNEWKATCGDFMGIVKKPCAEIGFKDLLKCDQADWQKALQEWIVLEFWAGVAVNVLGFLIYFIQALIAGTMAGLVSGIITMGYGVGLAYLYAHLGWFAILKKGGCCCFLIICIEWKIMLLVWGCLLCFYGGWMILSAVTLFLSWLTVGGLSIILGAIYAVLYAVYGVVLLYMGICILRIWKAGGVTGASATAGGQAVGDAVVVGAKS